MLNETTDAFVFVFIGITFLTCLSHILILLYVYAYVCDPDICFL